MNKNDRLTQYCAICLLCLLFRGFYGSQAIIFSSALEFGDYLPPLSGTWVIDEPTQVENRIYTINGSIQVISGGSLILKNVTLKINSDELETFEINVETGGSLVVDYDSMILAEDAQYRWDMEISSGAGLILLQNSTLKNMHHLLLNNTLNYIVNCTFEDLYSGIQISGETSDSTIINNTFSDCITAIHLGDELSTDYGGDANVSITDNVFTDCSYGVYIVSIDNITVSHNNFTTMGNSAVLIPRRTRDTYIVDNYIIDGGINPIYVDYGSNNTYIGGNYLNSGEIKSDRSLNTQIENNTVPSIAITDSEGNNSVINNCIEGGDGIYIAGDDFTPYIVGNTLINTNWGIRTYGAEEAFISNNYIDGASGSYSGIGIEAAPSAVLMDNTIKNTQSYGMMLEDVTTLQIANNSFNNTGNDAIRISGGSSGVIEKNNITFSNSEGIYIYNSGEFDILENSLSYMKDASIYIDNILGDLNIIQNTIDHVYDGIYMGGSGSYTNIVQNNTVSMYERYGIRLNYGLNTIENNTVETFGGNNAIRCEGGTNMVSNNSIIGGVYGISMANGNSHHVEQNYLHNISRAGIMLSSLTNTLIIKNTLIDNPFEYYGIYLHSSYNNVIDSNEIIFDPTKTRETYYAIEIDACHDNTIQNNLILHAPQDAIYINVADQAYNTDIINNTIYNASRYGIHNTGDYGLVAENTISECGNTGISSGGHSVDIFHNTVFDNDGFGMQVGNTLSTVWYNYVYNNTLGTVENAGNSIAWDNGSIGNFWGDYLGYDANHDGIGDVPYLIPEGWEGYDNYPLVDLDQILLDIVDPVVSSVGDLVVNYSAQYQEDHFILWTIDEENLSYYNITQNSTLVDEGFWFGSSMNFTVRNYIGYGGALSIGDYLYCLTVIDRSGNTASDTVVVMVRDQQAPNIQSSPGDMIYSEIEYFQLYWGVNDDSPNSYELYQNGTLYQDGEWSDDITIVFNPLTLEPGTYNFTLYVYDQVGYSASDSIIITILPDPNATANTSNDTTDDTSDDDTSDGDTGFDIPGYSSFYVGIFASLATVAIVFSRNKS
ncbi:right-handed parallel beta-helix repeat-containing protein [Candidatus Lokiarchaeum ossiferum]|uniref:right-handed parallel beta-helix repeat-containing protein n=1 Tax=Candidatus Lokiarchaeum ossiferum TaxID=2951803 RepID=UPI00352C9A21